MENTKQIHCTHKYHENNIHEFIIHESSRIAVDQMVGYIYKILEETSDEQSPLYLIDNSQVDAVPLRYLAQRIKEVNSSRSKDRKPGHIAILYEGIIADVANILLRSAMINKFRFFSPEKRDKAIEWLKNVV